MMRFPPFNMQRSSLLLYIRDNSSGRVLSILAGLLAWFGDGTEFMGGELVGFAASMVVQAYPLISILLGILLFKEFRGCTKMHGCLLAMGICAYTGAIVLLVASAI